MVLWLCRGKTLCVCTCNIKCVSNHVRFYDNLHSDKKKKKKEREKILCKCQSKLSVAHSRHTEPHYSDLDTRVRTKLDSIT